MFALLRTETRDAGRLTKQFFSDNKAASAVVAGFLVEGPMISAVSVRNARVQQGRCRGVCWGSWGVSLSRVPPRLPRSLLDFERQRVGPFRHNQTTVPSPHVDHSETPGTAQFEVHPEKCWLAVANKKIAYL